MGMATFKLKKLKQEKARKEELQSNNVENNINIEEYKERTNSKVNIKRRRKN